MPAVNVWMACRRAPTIRACSWRHASISRSFHKSQNRNLDQLLQYGPGRNDSTADGVHDPTGSPPVRPSARLCGALERGPPDAGLQIDRNLSQRSAPPSVVALVAAYLRSLGPAWAATARGDAPSAGQPSSAGAAIFERVCPLPRATALEPWPSRTAVASGHRPATRLGGAAEQQPRLQSPVAARAVPHRPYLHDGSVPTVPAMLDPRRAGGHRFGLDLSASERAALVAYLREL